MDANILTELEQIKWIMIALFVAVLLVILFIVSTIAFRVKVDNSQALLQIRDNYLAEITLLEIKGKYEEMLKKTDEMLLSFPNDMLGHWYSAMGQKQIGQLGAALTSLGQVKAINSGWNSEVIDELIANIKDEMSGPRANN